MRGLSPPATWSAANRSRVRRPRSPAGSCCGCGCGRGDAVADGVGVCCSAASAACRMRGEPGRPGWSWSPERWWPGLVGGGDVSGGHRRRRRVGVVEESAAAAAAPVAVRGFMHERGFALAGKACWCRWPCRRGPCLVQPEN